MIKVIGIRFRSGGKVYYFDPCGLELIPGMEVIVETARGVEIGSVAAPPCEVEEERLTQPLKNVVRIATKEDLEREEENRKKEKEALLICREKVEKHGLDMKLIGCEYAFDKSKILFYFTAEGRIDFRDLVKDLASVFRTRIELRQIGVRDETKLLGGMGICGRPLCCTTYLSNFSPVSIKMAKEQGLSLNPTKISGVCGRLMCCLNNEEETYEYLNSKLPAKGDIVKTPEGEEAKVASLNVLRQKIKVLVDVGEDEKEIREYDASDLTFKPRKKKGHGDKSKEAQKENGAKQKEGGGKKKKKRDNKDNKDKQDNKEQKQQDRQEKKQKQKQEAEPSVKQQAESAE